MKPFAKIALLCLSFASIPLLMAPRNGGGTYVLPAGNPVVSGTVISSTTHNTTMSDIATALTGSISKDGQTTPSANLPMGSFRHTSVGDASARNQYGVVKQIQDGDYTLVGSVSGTNTVAGSLSPAITAYAAGMQVVLIPANNNTGATTLNLNGVGALDVQKGNASALVADDLRAGLPALLALDTGGDDWILLNPASGTITSSTINNSGTVTSDVVAATTTLTVAGQSARDATNLFSSGTVPAARLPGSFNGFANPSGTIGLSAVNGSAATAMRSDGAPALSQAIAPTWTSLHTFSRAVGGGNGLAVGYISGSPGFYFQESGASANNKVWDFLALSEKLSFRTVNDANTVVGTWLTVDRTGTTVDEVNILATSVTANSSRINTVANSGKVAYASVSTGAVLSRSLNVTSASKPSAGVFDIDLTAAGFSVTPVCVASFEVSNPDELPTEIIAKGVNSTSAQIVTIEIVGTSFINADINQFNFICHGV